VEKWNVKKILDWGIDFFKGKDVPQPRLSAELLLASVLGSGELKTYKEHILKRLEHVPIQYILNEAYFRNIRLYVDENVLIPRPETELIVEKSLEIVKGVLDKKGSATIAEIGTGSGAIALSLYSELKNRSEGSPGSGLECTIIATDSSIDALEVARKNAQDILETRDLENIEFIQCDILPEAGSFMFKKYCGKIDIIISNPPYIREDDFPGLSREVREYEPGVALVAGRTGLEIYEKILSAAASYMTNKSPAYIILETDPIVSGGLLELVEGTIGFKQALLEKDYNKKDRILIANRSL